jgi:type II secretory pathway pseudopilin PulG
MEQAALLSKPKTSRMAIWSLILSFIPFACVVGLILGIIAAVKIKKRKEELTGLALAVGGIGVGALNCLVSCALAGIIAAIAIPNFISYSTKAKDAQVKVVARSVQIAVEEYRVEKNEWPMSVRDIEAQLPLETKQQKNPYNGKETYTVAGGALVDGEPSMPGQVGYVRPEDPGIPYDVVFYLKAGTERLNGELPEPPPQEEPQGD